MTETIDALHTLEKRLDADFTPFIDCLDSREKGCLDIDFTAFKMQVRAFSGHDNTVLFSFDLWIAGFHEEEKRMRRKMSNSKGFDATLQLPSGNYVFGDFKTLDVPGIELYPPASEALRLMHTLAADTDAAREINDDCPVPGETYTDDGSATGRGSLSSESLYPPASEALRLMHTLAADT
nr:hypothetical protein [Tanacetum cinerariifolium]